MKKWNFVIGCVLALSACKHSKIELGPKPSLRLAATKPQTPKQLSLSTDQASLQESQTARFKAQDGVPPFTYAIESGDGTIDSHTGEFQAPPQLPLEPQESVISVTDSNGASAQASIQLLTQFQSQSPSDPGFNMLWGMQNNGIQAPLAWAINQDCRTIPIAVVDTGIDYTHNDLTQNIWNNPSEIPGNGVDDDGNGKIDDIRGWNFVSNNNNPADDNDHGTHVAGTIGARAENNLGISGVCWQAEIVPIKLLDAQGVGFASDLIEAIDYSRSIGVKIINASFGAPGVPSQGISDAISRAQNDEILIVAASGNGDQNGLAINNDQIPHYPSSFPQDNIVSVGAIGRDGMLTQFSNFGLNSVDLAAPGFDIVSTVRSNQYASFSGTSMATPHVAGAAALLWAKDPSMNVTEVKQLLFNFVDTKTEFTNLMSTGGKLNLGQAMWSIR